ncbi:imelysin family protein [Flammeovirgaceae bacterium SG7u.111]|nr:imelysin family protein [Flammeovirgaceae bacterium SG7u.132]WPO35060.1 imelysin family protein [Flammeovirgaceae bacterium SG7u.111]
MRKASTLLLICIIPFFCTLFSCSEKKAEEPEKDNFDRQAMLTNWADNIIIPAYEAYVVTTADLVAAKDAFVNEPSETKLQTLKATWLSAYTAWQKVSMFEIGKAEELTLRDYTNIFPTNAAEIDANLQSGTWNLALPSTRVQQGFPALDYLLHGLAATEAETTTLFSTNENHRNYLSDVTDRIHSLADQVLKDWKGGYREAFIAESGSSANSSVNKLVNDYLFYYEKFLRAGKIGIPAGVFSNQPLSDNVEAFYNKDVSKSLFITSLQASYDFFLGKHFSGGSTGESLKSYLDFLNTITNGESLSKEISSKFENALSKGNLLGDNLYQEVETNNQAMLATYDALQEIVILMKVDMFQALNIKVDYVDADGD